MNAPSGKIPETKVRPEDNESRQESRQALCFTDNRPEALVQRQLAPGRSESSAAENSSISGHIFFECTPYPANQA